MTTEEFIQNVNALNENERDGVRATLFPTGEATIETSYTPMYEMHPRMLAILPKYTKSWTLFEKCVIPGAVLKLMGELADSKYSEREKKYVILNGNPFLLDGSILTRVFFIDEGNLSFATVTLDELNDFAYTKKELKQSKATLPKKLQDAVDMLTVTVGEAKKVLKHDHME